MTKNSSMLIMSNKKSYLYLIIWVAILLLISSAIGSFTKSSIDTWYKTLIKSPITPPNYLFGIAWTALYVSIATSGWIIWHSDPFNELKSIRNLYISQLLLNWSWTPIFFSYHLTGVSLICLCTIIILVVLLIIKAYKKIRTASLLLIPYLLWLLFAAHLNFYIWQYN